MTCQSQNELHTTCNMAISQVVDIQPQNKSPALRYDVAAHRDTSATGTAPVVKNSGDSSEGCTHFGTHQVHPNRPGCIQPGSYINIVGIPAMLQSHLTSILVGETHLHTKASLHPVSQEELEETLCSSKPQAQDPPPQDMDATQ